MKSLGRGGMATSSWSVPFASLCLLFSGVVTAASQFCSTENTGVTNGPHDNMYQSHGACTTSCGGFAFGILQGKSCWCSDYAPSLSDSVCSTTCPGYPADDCGSDDAFSYIALGPAAKGTGSPGFVGVPQQTPYFDSYTPSPPTAVFPVEPPSSSTSPPPPPPPPSSPSSPPEHITQSYPEPAPSPTFVPFIPVPVPDNDDPEPAPTTEAPSIVTARPVTSIQIFTVSGEVQTQVVTQVASPTPTPIAAPDMQQLPAPSKHGLSNGAVAGIAIGVVAVVALLAGLGFFIWRRRRNGGMDSEGNIRRNPSVLSRAGLLSGDSSYGSDLPYPATAARSVPTLRTFGLSSGSGPGSAVTAETQMSEARRTSKPLFVDNRLNPNALMEHPNASRTSIGTLQDDKDYTRPLEVRNPD